MLATQMLAAASAGANSTPPSPPVTALAFDAVGGGAAAASQNSITWTHTVGTSGNAIIYAAVLTVNASNNVSGVTCNGQAMTLVGAVNLTTQLLLVYQYVGPSTGINTIVVSLSSTVVCGGASVSYVGALQSGQPDATTSTTGIATTLQDIITTVEANCWAFMIYRAVTGTLSLSRGTLRLDNSGGQGFIIADNAAPVAAGAQIRLAGDTSISSLQGIQLVSIVPASD